jgi:ADP-heptose:LPS heptosyltransferase
VGIGDNIMATGMARGFAARSRRVAFGDGSRIIWDQNSEIVFRHNPNIAEPGAERASDIDWMAYYKGQRGYNRVSDSGRHWVWNYDFSAPRGEIFLNAAERVGGGKYGRGFVLVEPNVPQWKSVSVNKDWGARRYQAVIDKLVKDGFEVKQFRHAKGGAALSGVQAMPVDSFRQALAIMSNAAVYLGPEGGLHHAAAAFGIKAVVLFGGFIPPAVTGYAGHVNLTGGAEACGSLRPCPHCRNAMGAISVDEVFAATFDELRRSA